MQWVDAAATVLIISIGSAARAQPPRDPVRAGRGSTTPASTPAAPDTPTSSPATTTMSGRVVADGTGDPLPNARVALLSTTERTTVVLTDGQGRFVIAAEPGRRTLT